MRKTDFAEGILSLTTTPERAASTAGDLTEVANTRGTLWFAWNLLKTTASLVWRAFADAPLRLTWIAIQAFLIEINLLAGTGLILIVGGVFVMIAFFSGDVRPPSLGLKGEIAAFLFFEGLLMAVYFGIGRFLASRAPGRELSAVVLYLCVDMVFWTIVSFSIPQTGRGTSDLENMVLGPLIGMVTLLSLIVGIDQGRKKAAARRYA